MNEIEMKAWVDDVEVVRSRLEQLYEYKGEQIKEDTYFGAPFFSVSASYTDEKDLKRVETIRLRELGSSAIVTLKQKKVSQGMEINEEEEFSVSDACTFKKLLIRLGCTEQSKKRKHSFQYSGRNLTIELNHIDGLGWFVEVEKLCESAASEEEIRSQLCSVFKELEISPKNLEARFYTDLLAEVARTGKIGRPEE